MCQWVSVVHEHVSFLGVSRVHRQSASLRAWGKVGEMKGSGAATVLDSPAATSESQIAVGWQGCLEVSSPHHCSEQVH